MIPQLQSPESEKVTVQFCEKSDEPIVINGSQTSKETRCFQSQPAESSSDSEDV